VVLWETWKIRKQQKCINIKYITKTGTRKSVKIPRGRRDRDCMVGGLTTTCAISLSGLCYVFYICALLLFSYFPRLLHPSTGLSFLYSSDHVTFRDTDIKCHVCMIFLIDRNETKHPTVNV
jgi:hypothetical protein